MSIQSLSEFNACAINANSAELVIEILTKFMELQGTTTDDYNVVKIDFNEKNKGDLDKIRWYPIKFVPVDMRKKKIWIDGCIFAETKEKLELTNKILESMGFKRIKLKVVLDKEEKSFKK